MRHLSHLLTHSFRRRRACPPTAGGGRSPVLLYLLLLLLTGLIGCDGTPSDGDTPTANAPMTTVAAAPTLTVSPTVTPAAAPTRIVPSPAATAPTELYGNIDARVALELPGTWHVREGSPIRIASAASLLDSFDVAPNEAVMLLYTSRGDDFLGSLAPEITAVEVANVFLASCRLSSIGRLGELLLPFESTRLNGQDASVGALRVMTTEGATGTAYVSAIVSDQQKAVLVALTVAPTGQAILDEINDVTESLELLGNSGRVIRTGRFSPTSGTDAGAPVTAAEYHMAVEGGARLLVLLETDPDSNGVLTLRDVDRTELVTVNQGGNGVSEVIYYLAPTTAIYVLEVAEAGGDTGTYTLRTVDLRPGTETVQLFREQQYDPEQPIEFTFLGTGGEAVVLYVEPLGVNAALMDPVLEILDAETNYYARVDDRYQGEPEVFYFEPAADGNYMARVSDFFEQEGAYRITVARP